MKTATKSHTPHNIAEVLRAEGLLSEEKFGEAMRLYRRSDRPLSRILREMGAVDPAVEASILHDHCHCETIDLATIHPEQEALAMLPRRVCAKHHAVPLQVRNGRLRVAMEDPSDLNSVEAVESAASMPVEPLLARAESIEQAIDHLPLYDDGVRDEPSDVALWFCRFWLVVLSLAPLMAFFALLAGKYDFVLWWTDLRYDAFERILIFPMLSCVWASVLYWIAGLLPGVVGKAAQ